MLLSFGRYPWYPLSIFIVFFGGPSMSRWTWDRQASSVLKQYALLGLWRRSLGSWHMVATSTTHRILWTVFHQIKCKLITYTWLDSLNQKDHAECRNISVVEFKKRYVRGCSTLGRIELCLLIRAYKMFTIACVLHWSSEFKILLYAGRGSEVACGVH